MGRVFDFLLTKGWWFLFGLFLISLLLYGFLFENRLDRTLFSPQTLGKQYFSEINEETGVSTTYSLDGISYAFKKNYAVNFPQYTSFYEEIKNLRALINVAEVERTFAPKAKLNIYLDDIRLQQKELWQTVEIDDNIFRVLQKKPLYFPFSSKQWLYYHKEGIFDFAQKIFAR